MSSVIGIQQVAKAIAKLMTSTASTALARQTAFCFWRAMIFTGCIKACLSVISKTNGLQQEAHLLFLYAATTTRYAYPLTSGEIWHGQGAQRRVEVVNGLRQAFTK